MRRREFLKEDDLVFPPLRDLVGDCALVSGSLANGRARPGPSIAAAPPPTPLEVAL